MNNKSQIEASKSVVPREAVATPEDAARALSLTKEELEEIKRDQLLALYRSRARLSDNDRRIARGVELERHYILTGNMDGLAEALSLQGRYAEAAEAATASDRKEELSERAGAVDKEDRLCGCDSHTENGKYNLPNRHIEFYGHSAKHGGEVTFIRCSRCGDLNAMPAPAHLLEQRELRRSKASDQEKLAFFKCK